MSLVCTVTSFYVCSLGLPAVQVLTQRAILMSPSLLLQHWQRHTNADAAFGMLPVSYGEDLKQGELNPCITPSLKLPEEAMCT
jgi:hypothetical protein